MDSILPENFDKNVEIAKRAYDGLYNLWRRMVRLHEDNSFDIYWEVIGVYDSYNDASQAKEAYRKRVQKL